METASTEGRRPGDSPTNRPIINIVGDLVALGPGGRDLLPRYTRWDNDFFMQRTLGNTPTPWTLEQLAAADNAGDDSGRHVAFTIYRRADWRPIGFTGWRDIDGRNRTATFVIGIGEADCRGRGYDTETTRLMLDYTFTGLGLHSVMLTVYEYNLGGLRAYTKAGFREFGRRRQAQWMGGRLWDIIYMDCLASEFTSPVLGRLFVPDQPPQ